MNKFDLNIPKATIRELEQRSARVSLLVEAATQNAERGIRDGGSELIDRVNEWLDEIKDLVEVGDHEAVEKIESFRLRLRLAEHKIKSWAIPARIRKSVLSKTNPQPTRRRRGRPRKNAA